MSFQLSSEQFRTMIFYDWKIALTYKDSEQDQNPDNMRLQRTPLRLRNMDPEGN